MKNLAILLLSLLLASSIYFSYGQKESESVSAYDVETTLSGIDEAENELTRHANVKRPPTKNEQVELEKHQLLNDSVESIPFEESVVNFLINENGSLNFSEINSLINDEERFSQLLIEVQNPISQIDVESYQQNYESLSQIIALSKYSYSHGCSKGICALEVKSVLSKDESNQLNDIIGREAIGAPYTYELIENSSGEYDLRMVFQTQRSQPRKQVSLNR